MPGDKLSKLEKNLKEDDKFYQKYIQKMYLAGMDILSAEDGEELDLILKGQPAEAAGGRGRGPCRTRRAYGAGDRAALWGPAEECPSARQRM